MSQGTAEASTPDIRPTAPDVGSPTAPGESPYPRRHMTAVARNRRTGRLLRLLAGLREPTASELDVIGRRSLERDELGAAVARAMRLPKGSPERVTMPMLRQAIAGGLTSLDNPPPAVRDFFERVESVPDWVDFDLCNEGARTFLAFGLNGRDILTQLALIGGYRYAGPADLLVETGGLTGDRTRRRLAETQQWTCVVTEQDAMRPGAEGYRTTVHVRLMHALVNHAFETNGRWDSSELGLPINQTDQAGTLGLFSGAVLIGVRSLGVRVTAEQSRAVMHLWKYIGWLMGIDEDWLCDNEHDQHQLNYSILLASADVSEAGPKLARAVIDVEESLDYPNLVALRRRYGRARTLSMLRVLIGKPGLEDLRLPVTIPWAYPIVLAQNIVRYWLRPMTPAGRRRLEAYGRRSREQTRAQFFGAQDRAVAELPE